MKKILMLTVIISVSFGIISAQTSYDDDIYYNPKKDKSLKETKTNGKSKYIKNIAEMDVDEYNGMGNYTPIPADTFGTAVTNGEDFLYTQQIQKYYNPTIVVDNANLLGDILNNSYGNVNVVIENNGISLSPWNVYYPYGYYGYNNWYSSRYYPGWSISFGLYDPWNPWFAFNPLNPWYNPWYPIYGGWNYGWAWNPAPPRPGTGWGHYAPQGNHRVGAGGNWAAGYNHNGVNRPGTSRPSGNYRPGYINRPGTNNTGNIRPGNGNLRPGNNMGNSRPGNGNSRPGDGGNNRPGVGNMQAGTPIINGTNTSTVNSTGNNKNNNGNGNHRSVYRPSNELNKSTPNRESTYNNRNITRPSNQGSGSFRNSGGFGGNNRSSGSSMGGRGRHR